MNRGLENWQIVIQERGWVLVTGPRDGLAIVSAPDSKRLEFFDRILEIMPRELISDLLIEMKVTPEDQLAMGFPTAFLEECTQEVADLEGLFAEGDERKTTGGSDDRG